MAGRKLSYIAEAVRDVLRDEFVEGVDLEVEPDELRRIIRRKLDEIEVRMPYEVKATAFDPLTTVATELSASATNLVVASDDDFSTDYPFYITIENEVLKVTALASADNFTVTRAQKDSTAAVHAVGKNVAVTIVTTEDYKEIDISDIDDIIRVIKAEFRISRPPRYPREFRNCELFGDELSLDIAYKPEDDEEVHLYLHKRHILTDNESTLTPQIEVLLIQGAAAEAALNLGREYHNALKVGGVNVGQKMINWGKDQLIIYRGMLNSNAKGIPYKDWPTQEMSSGA